MDCYNVGDKVIDKSYSCCRLSTARGPRFYLIMNLLRC